MYGRFSAAYCAKRGGLARAAAATRAQGAPSRACRASVVAKSSRPAAVRLTRRYPTKTRSSKRPSDRTESRCAR